MPANLTLQVEPKFSSMEMSNMNWMDQQMANYSHTQLFKGRLQLVHQPKLIKGTAFHR